MSGQVSVGETTVTRVGDGVEQAYDTMGTHKHTLLHKWTQTSAHKHTSIYKVTQCKSTKKPHTPCWSHLPGNDVLSNRLAMHICIKHADSALARHDHDGSIRPCADGFDASHPVEANVTPKVVPAVLETVKV